MNELDNTEVRRIDAREPTAAEKTTGYFVRISGNRVIRVVGSPPEGTMVIP